MYVPGEESEPAVVAGHSEDDGDESDSTDSPGDSDDYDDHDDREDSMDLDYLNKEIRAMCQQYIELVTDNKMNQAGAIASLNIHRSFIANIFGDAMICDLFPKTYYMMQKLARTDSELEFEFGNGSVYGCVYDICPTEDGVFPTKAVQVRLRDVRKARSQAGNAYVQETCRLCGELRTSNRQMLYFCIVTRCQKMWGQQETRNMLL